MKSKSVFLAGSIEDSRAPFWQDKAVEVLAPTGATLLNPRRENWDPSWSKDPSHPEFRNQVEWELDGLALSDYILMYFDPATQSPITLLELGLYAPSGKLFVCCPQGFWRKGNIDIVCEKYKIPTFETLELLLDDMRKKLDSK